MRANAEALIGKVLGSCVLQRVIGQGGMAAVYLAQQSRPRRQVAVKVLLPPPQLTSKQLASFLERFRRETDAAASLAHPHILPVHEYGEQDGLAYLVMPYIAGGTLREHIEHEGPFAFPKIVNYLSQLAAALDAAHERGVIHRDVKPANILMTPEGRLLLTDFGLVKVVAEGQAPQVHLTGVGMPMGTPDYMAPEQVLGGAEVDTRADLYSLGVILYQMVTGTLPFRGETPMQVVAQHLQSPPPSPRSLRPEVSLATEQVMLRALAKRPTDRYRRAQDLLSAFGVALTLDNADRPVAPRSVQTNIPVIAPRPRGLFDPSWQTGVLPLANQQTALPMGHDVAPSSPTAPLGPKTSFLRAARKIGVVPFTPDTREWTASSPSDSGLTPPPPVTVDTPNAIPRSTGLLSSVRKTRMLPEPGLLQAAPIGEAITPLPPIESSPSPIYHTPTDRPEHNGRSTNDQVPPIAHPNSSLTGKLSAPAGSHATMPLPPLGITGALMVPNNEQGAPTTIKLTAPAKVVQVPIAGQPGRYVTGLLPASPLVPRTQETKDAQIAVRTQKAKIGTTSAAVAKGKQHRMPLLLALVALVVVLGSLGTFWLVRAHSGQMAQTQSGSSASRYSGTPNAATTAQARATATAQANIILFDPLSQNIHNWVTATTGPQMYMFKDSAYHIINNSDTLGVPAILPDGNYGSSLVYSLTIEEIKGNEASVNNAFGMIFRYSSVTKKGRLITTCYAFEVTNTKNGQYQLWKFDDSGASGVSPWTELWYHTFGGEFRQGHGSTAINTIKISMNGSKFTFSVNEKQVAALQDKSLTSGGVGMLVNLKGTEVAFSNLLLTNS